ncbi:MAG: deoxyribose-phosphate aldolase, partial [Metamycoplasmataceae bacterium]
MKFVEMIDHTYLKPEGTSKEIDKLIDEAIEWKFGGVCVNSSWVKHAKARIGKNKIKIISVVGFPLGAAATQAKVHEAKLAIDHGADE